MLRYSECYQRQFFSPAWQSVNGRPCSRVSNDYRTTVSLSVIVQASQSHRLLATSYIEETIWTFKAHKMFYGVFLFVAVVSTCQVNQSAVKLCDELRHCHWTHSVVVYAVEHLPCMWQASLDVADLTAFVAALNSTVTDLKSSVTSLQLENEALQGKVSSLETQVSRAAGARSYAWVFWLLSHGRL